MSRHLTLEDYTNVDPLFLQELILICGEDNVSVSLPDRLAYSRDAFPLVYKWVLQKKIPYIPTYIVRPSSTEEVVEIVRLCVREKVPYVPFGGGSGIVGGALATKGGLIIDLKRMNRILSVDETSLTAVVEAGIIGQHFEEKLNQRGFTCGHYPQSIGQSTVGGWIAHRGVGTYSTKYGKIDDLVVSLEVVLPSGETVVTRDVPKSATGPNLNELFIGSEGTLGIITKATLKIFRQPEEQQFKAYAYADFGQGIEAIRRVIHRDIRPAVVRLYDAVEAQHHFSELVTDSNVAVLLLGFAGYRDNVRFEVEQAERVMVQSGGIELGDKIGRLWLERRFSTVGLCNTLRTRGGVADALEVTGSWSNLFSIYNAMKQAMEHAVGPDGSVFGHVSHVYHSGGNLYMIFHAKDSEGSDEWAEQIYYKVLRAAFEACLENGGTLSHHHGVGIGKARWMRKELGEAGYQLLKRIKSTLDHDELLNSGKLGL